jgi:16S rRNA C967 or C1407 C5-methylase (RsmB/RsmF family)
MLFSTIIAKVTRAALILANQRMFHSPSLIVLSFTHILRTTIMQDEHIPELLQFHPLTQFHDDECLSAGQVILQDKASCFPARVLNPPAEDGTHVIDATAAPGNKTSHLSAIMKGKGKVSVSFGRLGTLAEHLP